MLRISSISLEGLSWVWGPFSSILHHSSSQLSSSAQGTWLFSLDDLASVATVRLVIAKAGSSVSPYLCLSSCIVLDIYLRIPLWWLAVVKEAALPLPLSHLPRPCFCSFLTANSKAQNNPPVKRWRSWTPEAVSSSLVSSLSSNISPSREMGVNTALSLRSHHPPPMVGTSSGLGVKGGKFPFSSVNCCNEVTLSPPSFGYLFSWHFSESQRICFPFAVLLPETVIALWTYRSRKPIKGPRGQGFSASQHIPQLLSSCKNRVLLASQKGYYNILFKFKADFKSNSTTHLIVIIIPAICIIIFTVIIITNTEISMERSLQKTQVSSLPYSILQAVMTDIITRKSRLRAWHIKLWKTVGQGF